MEIQPGITGTINERLVRTTVPMTFPAPYSGDGCHTFGNVHALVAAVQV